MRKGRRKEKHEGRKKGAEEEKREAKVRSNKGCYESRGWGGERVGNG